MGTGGSSGRPASVRVGVDQLSLQPTGPEVGRQETQPTPKHSLRSRGEKHPPRVGEMSEMKEFPAADMELTTILVVSDFAASLAWYRDVLGARLHREYGGTSAVFDFNGVWLLVVTGGEPTADKPGISFAPPASTESVGHSFTIRVQNCQRSYDTLVARGAEFLTPPYDWGAEIRCFFRDPDGHLFEISEIPGG